MPPSWLLNNTTCLKLVLPWFIFSVASVVSDSLQPYGLYSPEDSSVYGIFQAGILEWIAMPSSRGSSLSRDPTQVSCTSCIVDGFFTTELLGKSIFSVVFIMSYLYVFAQLFIAYFPTWKIHVS